MNVKIPKGWDSLPPRQKKLIEDYCKKVCLDSYNNDIALVLDTYIKMACIILHDNFGFGEKRLRMFIAAHRMMFRHNFRWVKERTQNENLNKRLKEIFRKEGWPKQAFDDIVGRLNPDD